MKLVTNEKLEVLRFSDRAYNNLTAEIQYMGEPIAQVNTDKGFLELELFTDFGDPEFILKFPLDDFLLALNLAKETLSK